MREIEHKNTFNLVKVNLKRIISNQIIVKRIMRANRNMLVLVENMWVIRYVPLENHKLIIKEEKKILIVMMTR